MKILWLCSWYPHSSDPFDGDFIERHAKAVAIQHPIDVIHIVQNTNLLLNEEFRIEEKQDSNLKSKIIYIPHPKTPFSKLSAILFNQRYNKTLKNELLNYIKANGIPDLVHLHVPVKMGVGALWLKRKFKAPFVVSEHSNIYHQKGKENYNAYSPYFRLITNNVLKEAETLISVSDFLGTAMNTVAIKKKYTVIPNVVDTSLFYFSNEKQPNKLFRFLHVSSLSPVKNTFKMLEAIHTFLKSNENAEFIFIGNKNKELHTVAMNLGISEKNIHFLGEIPYQKVAEQMRKADAFFLFSKSESFSCVTAEALCCGLPVIASNVGALPELIHNNGNGILVTPDDTDALAAAMHYVQVNYHQFNRNKIEEEASAKYNYNEVATQILSVYKKVLQRD